MNISKAYDFSKVSDYSFDASKIVVSGNKASLKSQVPSDMTFFASFINSKDADFALGSPTGTLNGGAIVNNGFLVISGSTDGCQYSWAGDFDIDNQGTLRFKYTPAYSGNPSARNIFFGSGHTTPPYPNHMELGQDIDGKILFYLSDNSGTPIVNNGSFGTWVPVAGTEYEFEINVDCVSGNHRLFINGILFGTLTGTGMRDATGATGFIIGNDLTNQTYGALGNFRNVQIYNTVQHVSDYTPSLFTIYPVNNPSITGNASFYNQGLISFVPSIDISGNDLIRYALSMNGAWLWWNGTGWVTSNQTYAQANTSADINANIASFPLTGFNTQFQAFIHSDNGLTTPDITLLTINYTAYYSTIDQLRKNLVNVTSTLPGASDALVLDRIAHSDDDIQIDLQKYINFALVPASYGVANFPAWLNHLSQYKTCVHVLRKLYGAQRKGDDNSDIESWEKQYQMLFKDLKLNRTEPVLPDGTDVSKGQNVLRVGRTQVSPVLGAGKYGQFENVNDLAKDRPAGGRSPGGFDTGFQ